MKYRGGCTYKGEDGEKGRRREQGGGDYESLSVVLDADGSGMWAPFPPNVVSE